ncbi:MAG: IS200/IS605 family transposase [Cyclobacteriaceae bacterium]|nr:IS200/IS605 family transposase [Cyclobacteriaceae bacterium]
MPYLKVWIHAVWSTEQRRPYLIQPVRQVVFDHIKANSLRKGILIDRINGYFDHTHVLFRLPNDLPISKVIQLIKGESSYWINKENLISERFSWQDEYFAASISESDLPSVSHYIDHQESHHKNKTFMQEYTEMIKELGVVPG